MTKLTVATKLTDSWQSELKKREQANSPTWYIKKAKQQVSYWMDRRDRFSCSPDTFEDKQLHELSTSRAAKPVDIMQDIIEATPGDILYRECGATFTILFAAALNKRVGIIRDDGSYRVYRVSALVRNTVRICEGVLSPEHHAIIVKSNLARKERLAHQEWLAEQDHYWRETVTVFEGKGSLGWS